MATWEKDIVLDGFEMRRLDFPDDYEGKVYATLVRRNAKSASKKAVLYIHGYMDYFFQPHLADAFNDAGFNFYALDLRKYGRSLRAGQHPNFCKDIREYFAEISAAIRILREEDGNDYLVLNGHSTGGLSASLYAATGEERQHIKALVLNSPFFDWNVGRVLQFIMGNAARIVPEFNVLAEAKEVSPYMQSIVKAYHGEWEMNLEWRKPNGFPIYAGWVRAITNAHQEVKQGLAIQCPVLLMYSDKSIYGSKYEPKFQTGDAILNVAHIKAGGKHLGKQLKEVEIKDGLHDLILSRKEVREKVLTEMVSWLNSL